VEVGLLIDALEKGGLEAIAQIDLMERIHRNQTLEPLSKMSFAIIQTVISKLEKRLGSHLLEDINKTMKLIRYERPRYFLDVEKIAEASRPPMIEIPEYQRLRH
jgi:glucosyl-3-phosphoglycerate synthase